MRDCTICNHEKRNEIDTELVKGRSVQAVASFFAVDYACLYRHSKNHLSKTLMKAVERQEVIHENELMETVSNILKRAEDIFVRNYDAKHDVTALKALAETRATIELLAKISYQLNQARLAELELLKEKSGDTAEQARELYLQQISILSFEEALVYKRFNFKIINQNTDLIIKDGKVLVRNTDYKQFTRTRDTDE
jgi:hypothetical protein